MNWHRLKTSGFGAFRAEFEGRGKLLVFSYTTHSQGDALATCECNISLKFPQTN